MGKGVYSEDRGEAQFETFPIGSTRMVTGFARKVDDTGSLWYLS